MTPKQIFFVCFMPLFGLFVELYAIVFGIIAINRGRVPITRKWVIHGVKARAVGCFCVLLGIALMLIMSILHYMYCECYFFYEHR